MASSNEFRKTISVTKILNASSIPSFLYNISIIFSTEHKELPFYSLDLSKIKKINVLGLLLIYKIIEYSVEKRCFKQPIVLTSSYIEGKLDEYDFTTLINSYIYENDSSKRFKDLKVQVTEKCIIAPQPLLREKNFTNNYLKNKFLPKITSYYESREKVISMIFTCFSEILLNFWEHAVIDTKSIMIADGNKNFMEIACADTGDGIVSTLRNNPKYANLSDQQIIRLSIQKNVTSKENTHHMGFGLWLIDQIVSEIKGRFHLFSEGILYSNEQGTRQTNKTGYWKGTIVYIALPINNAKSLGDIETLKDNKIKDIKVNFV